MGAFQDDPLSNLADAAKVVLLHVGLVAIVLVVNNFLQKRSLPMPEAISTIIIGILLGGALLISHEETPASFQVLESAAARQFLLVFIAPIIFAEGYGLKSRQFFQNIMRILTHAFLGTLLSSIVVAVTVVYIPRLLGQELPDSFSLVEGLAFGAMISSTDPVTTLAIFKEQHMVENGLGYLYYSVLGESILNDAVAVTLFDSFGTLVQDNTTLTPLVFLEMLGTFCSTFCVSTAIGVVGGLATALVLKLARLGHGSKEEEHFHFNVPEIGVTLALAYVPFLLSEALGQSGIVAIMFAGITMRHYAHYNLTHTTRQVFLPVVELMSSLCETYVFTLLGLGVFVLSKEYSATMILCTLVSCFLGRALHVYPCSWVLNRCSSAHALSFNEQHVLWFAGLRGAVAFMCSLGFPESETSKHRDVVKCTTLTVVAVTVVFLGWPTSSVLRCLKIKSYDLDAQLQVPARAPAGSAPATRRARLASKIEQLLMTDESWLERIEVQTTSAAVAGERLSNGPGFFPWPSAGLSDNAAVQIDDGTGPRPHSLSVNTGARMPFMSPADLGRLSAPPSLQNIDNYPRPPWQARYRLSNIPSLGRPSTGRPSTGRPSMGRPSTGSLGSRSDRMLCDP